jgi:hypothetical protein
MKTIFAACLAALLSGPALGTEPVYDVIPETAEGTEAFMKQRFPAGADIKSVVAYLKAQTFDCAPAKDPTLGDAPLKGDYVFCERLVAYGFLVGKRWQVAIVPEKNAVKDYRASFGYVGR